MEKRCDVCQNTAMIPNPYIQILAEPSLSLDLDQFPSAVICGYDADKFLIDLQAQADTTGFPLIRKASINTDNQSDGFWTSDPGILKSLRQKNPDWQLVGIAQNRHDAMTLGEAGADLVLFGYLDPIVIAGDLELAMWWTELFEVPCGLILNETPPKEVTFGEPGWPEFFAKAS